MNSSNGISYITEMEAKLGDMLREGFPADRSSHEAYLKCKERLDSWARENGIRAMSFWDYAESRRKHPELHFAPLPMPKNGNQDAFLVFSHEMALRVLYFGQIPKCRL